ncbi:hypothetical protein LWI29_013565 [Acer saccharum]|uniref:Uncharacterized protein n=1 Tax=Acer saccharum TaxID=4024 RepID=A0AA39TFD2_ACESA|nr:hypothetical protein LWI29_013565 [Acer saccharum]
MARSICILLTHGRHSVVDQVYNIVVGDDNSQSSSIMYVALLLEECGCVGVVPHGLESRHWALVHLALAAFGYLASRTNCTQLWKFVPQDAALSYDLVSGNEPNEGRFMSEFKVFLDKELALVTVAHSSEQLELLVKEGRMLREITQKVSDIKLEPTGCENIETDGGIQRNKRRKLPDGISKGVELLQDGLKVIGDGISQWQQNQSDSIELQDKFLTQLSCLEDVISQIVGMTNSG